MTEHLHSFDHWPFAGAVNQACFLREHVHDGRMPILTVCHDYDGDWQFLCGGNHTGIQPVLVCLGCAVERHHAPVEMADLSLGWAADRPAIGAPWVKERLPSEEDGDF